MPIKIFKATEPQYIIQQDRCHDRHTVLFFVYTHLNLLNPATTQ